MKHLLHAWLMIMCLVLFLYFVAIAEASSFEIKSKTWMQTSALEEAETGSEIEFRQEVHRIEYDETGLAVKYITLIKSGTPYAVYSYKDGEVVKTESLNGLAAELAERLIGPTDPLIVYELAYEFDDHGNPTRVQLISKGKAARGLVFVNQYEGETIVSVSTDPLLDTGDTFPLYDLVGHFAGYESAKLIFGMTHYQNRDGALVATETCLDWESENQHVTRNEYENGRMIKTTATYAAGSTTESFTRFYDSTGRLEKLILAEGDKLLTASVRYENGVDDHDRDCLIGTFALDASESNSPDEAELAFTDMRVYCYVNELGTLTEMVTNAVFGVQTIEKFDERGAVVYEERLVGVADQNGNVYSYSRTIEETRYEYR